MMSSSPLASNVTVLLDELTKHGKDLSHQIPGAREALIADARSLIASLETSMEAITWMARAESARNTAVRIAVDLGLFEKLAANECHMKSSVELADMTGANPRLVGRILKHLAAMHVVAEVGVDRYKPTTLSLAMTVPKYRDAMSFCFDCLEPSFLKLPSYLKSTRYGNPEDSANGPFQYAFNTKSSFWDWKNEHPQQMVAFDSHMAGYAEGRPRWMNTDFYPVAERLGHGLKAGDSMTNTLIVDIGGGMGHDLAEFKRKHPDLPGRLILQDLPETIQQIEDIPEGVEPTVHDFFTPQPIKGARAYYMHSVLHSFTDEECQTTLQQLVNAMEKGYSKILINEHVVPDIGASWRVTSLDWIMMAQVASFERTEAQWRDLLGSVGLKIVGIWTKEPGVESLIEAVLVNDDTANHVDD